MTQIKKIMGNLDGHIENLGQRVEGLKVDFVKIHDKVHEDLPKLESIKGQTCC